jgi:NAD(P)-dependent dehydrogenase (short-subunit alcohol dehydrogenase family)
MDLGLNGKACIVTGATSGIGAATARLLASEGASVLGIARSGSDFDADVTAPDAGERIVAACVQRYGRVDVLVNNAGTTPVKSLDELTDEDWQSQWELNVQAPRRLMQAAAPRMAEQGWAGS